MTQEPRGAGPRDAAPEAGPRDLATEAGPRDGGARRRRSRFYRPPRLPQVSRRRFVAAGVVFGGAWLAGSFLFSEYGLRNLLVQKRIERGLLGRIDTLEARLGALGREREALRDDPAAIERVAREEYLFGKEGEVTYVFVPVDSTGRPLPPGGRPPTGGAGSEAGAGAPTRTGKNPLDGPQGGR